MSSHTPENLKIQVSRPFHRQSRRELNLTPFFLPQKKSMCSPSRPSINSLPSVTTSPLPAENAQRTPEPAEAEEDLRPSPRPSPKQKTDYLAEIIEHVTNDPDDVHIVLGKEAGVALLATCKAEERNGGPPFATALTEKLRKLLEPQPRPRQRKHWRKLQRDSTAGDLSDSGCHSTSAASVTPTPAGKVSKRPSPSTSHSSTRKLTTGTSAATPPPKSSSPSSSLPPQEPSPAPKHQAIISRPPASSPIVISSSSPTRKPGVSPVPSTQSRGTFGPRSRQDLSAIQAAPIASLPDDYDDDD